MFLIAIFNQNLLADNGVHDDVKKMKQHFKIGHIKHQRNSIVGTHR